MIHYHGMPLSGRDKTAVKCMQGKHACISYADTQPLALCAELCQSFILDNGAFTTWKQGKEYDIEGFAELVTDWHRHPSFDWYIIPDSIEGADKENNVMRAKWRNLVSGDIFSRGVPVWHLHESIETLNYLSRAYSRVAFGSSGEYAQVGDSAWWQRMAEAMDAICDDGLPRCKIHGLRMLDPTIFSHFPFSSADSTNVARNIGIDSAWKGTYPPQSKHTRALVMMERIEAHASSSRWNMTQGLTRNTDLFG
jgi:hypothetical protein